MASLKKELEKAAKNNDFIQPIEKTALHVGARVALMNAIDLLRRGGYNATTAPDILQGMLRTLDQHDISL